MAAEAAMDPIRIEVGTIAIFGGGLKTAWVPDISVVDGITFMRLSATNRKLAALCGCKIACSHPQEPETYRVGERVLGRAGCRPARETREAQRLRRYPPDVLYRRPRLRNVCGWTRRRS